MDADFQRRLDDAYDSAHRGFDEGIEELYRLARDYREALEQIAYPVNYPTPIFLGTENFVDPRYQPALARHHECVAANALTNGGRS